MHWKRVLFHLKNHLYESWLYFQIKKSEFFTEKEIKKRFYKDAKYKKLDQSLLAKYRFRSPYRISKDYLQNLGEEEIHTYGETPLPTIAKIIQEARLSSSDFFVEMGSGRGRISFFISHFVGCTVWAIERIPTFVEIAKKLAAQFYCSNISFFCQDMTKMDISFATIVYFYGLCLPKEKLQNAIQCLENMVLGSKVITVSYPLCEYTPYFEVEKRFLGKLPWGEAAFFINKKI